MKTKLILFLLILSFAACRSSREGCEGAKSVGPKFKADKFDWKN